MPAATRGPKAVYRCFAFSRAVATAFIFIASHAAADSSGEAAKLLREGKALAAYQLLQKEEAQRAGDPEFDYLLGRSALEAGEPSKATLIFERVLAVSPNHAGARLDMGRAYFALADYPRAKTEFESLLSLNPPPAAQATIRQYLAAIESRSKALQKQRLTAYTELGIGRDSNVTVGPRSSTLFFPVFGQNFTLAPSGQAQSASFHQLAAGAELTQSLDERSAFFIGADLRVRNYSKLDPYDQANGEIRGGLMHRRGDDNYRVFASFADLQLGNDRYRQVTTLGGDWRRQIDQRHQLTVFAQTSEIRYVRPSTSGNNNHLYLAGASWVRQPAVQGNMLLSASAFAGREQEDLERTDGSKNILGLRGALMIGLSPEVDAYGGLTFQYGSYSRTNLLYQEKRKDQQYDLSLGLNWRFAAGWSLRPQLNWTRNNSNTSVNAYDRTEGSLIVRKDF